jgi:hypothetical protein
MLLKMFLERLRNVLAHGEPTYVALDDDVLDGSIRTVRSIAAVHSKRSELSSKWGIISSLQPHDFVEALEATR